MVKVTFKPWEEVIIHEATHHSLDDIVTLSSMGVQPGGLAGPLQWAEGVVFRTTPMPPTDDVVKESLQGKIHLIYVAWAHMPKYKNVIPIKEISAKIPIVNVSAVAALCDVVKALKRQAEE